MLLQVSLAPASASSALPGAASDMLTEVGVVAAHLIADLLNQRCSISSALKPLISH